MKTRRPLFFCASLCLFAAICLSSGCTSTTYTDPTGAKFTRRSFLTKQSAATVQVKAGDKSLTLEGYSNEQTETAAAVAAAVARSLSPKP